MNKVYKQLNDQDRITIEIQLSRWAKKKEIAQIIWCHPSSITREVKRNSVKKRKSEKMEYSSKDAVLKAYQRCWRKNTQSKKINIHTDLKMFIISELESENIYISPAHSYKGYKTNKTPKKSKIQKRVWIEERSYENKNRIEAGHFEADLIVSQKWFKWTLPTQ